MSVRQQSIQWAGFYVAGLLCLALTVVKLTIERHWSWWRILLPSMGNPGPQHPYIVIGFIWLSFVSQGAPEQDITVRDPPFGYELGAMTDVLHFDPVCFFWLFARPIAAGPAFSSTQFAASMSLLTDQRFINGFIIDLHRSLAFK